MAVVRSTRNVATLLLNNSKIISRVPKPMYYSNSLLSRTSILYRSDGPLLRPKVGRICSTGSAWFEHVSSVHTKGDKELVEFITEEIKAELKLRKHHPPPEIEGFEVKTDGAEVTMSKKFNHENITVKLNVNHSVQSEESDDVNPPGDKESHSQAMKSKPDFTVEIEKGGKTLAFACSFSTDMMPDEQSQDSYIDSFQITELTLYDKEWEDETYSIDGDTIDGNLYDLLMNMLEERGINDEFTDKLVDYCTSYEHGLYIGLLKELKEFVSEK